MGEAITISPMELGRIIRILFILSDNGLGLDPPRILAALFL
jgi:hypothetical protein